MWSGVAKLLERQQKGGTGKSVNACQGSPQADRDYVARTAEVGQTHGDGWSGRDADGHSNVHLVQTGDSGSLAEKQNLGEASADGYLRRKHASVHQAHAIDFQGLSGSGGVAGRAFPPGSTFKIVTALAGLRKNLATARFN